MKTIKVCEYSRSRSFHYDLILQDQASGERSQDQWSSGIILGISGLTFAEVLLGLHWYLVFAYCIVSEITNMHHDCPTHQENMSVKSIPP